MWFLVAAVVGWKVWMDSKVKATSRTLAATLPARLSRWSDELAAAAHATKPADFTPEQWGGLLAAVMDRESAGGDMLTPKGPGGVGDFGHGRGLMQLDDRGAKPAASALEQRLAAGRLAFLSTGRWMQAADNILAGARILRAYYDAAPSLQHAVAAYNAGDKVFPLAEPDERTYGGNYSADVLARAAGFAGEELLV